MRGRGRIVALCVAATVGSAASAVPARADGVSVPGCAPSAHQGGEWRAYGNDLLNTRSQPAEKTITPQNVGSLVMGRRFTAPQAQPGAGGFHNTPVIADGCMYLATNTGWVFALNADTGDLLWRTHLAGNAASLIGGVITGSVSVGNGLVYVGVSKTNEPYLAALDQQSGRLRWKVVVDETPNSLLVSSPVLYDDSDGPLVFQGFMGSEGTATPRGGYTIHDAVTGEIVAKDYTIADEDYAAGYRGASIWSTAAVDPDTNYIYVGTGNPASKKIEHRHANALLMIDGDRDRGTFGRIVNAFKGNPDQYFPGLHRQPVCDEFGDRIAVVWSQACLQLDLDFGASPNIFTDHLGRKLVGALQKSGVYYALFADNMQLAWSTVVGGPGVPLNSSSTAVAGGRVFVPAQPPSQLWALQVGDGRYDWVQPIADVVHYQSVSEANGVVYTVDLFGNLLGFDAVTGLPVLRRPVSLDVGSFKTDGGNSSGIAIARNALYVVVSDSVLVYKLP
ncbi:MAG TPA: PQQ-binding-like beta-propeller repeat protein [Actinomycetota bacterium]|nr:PQQ-binding-like beta-propeller repeat protein [Actinomycetota bacterium]